MYIQILTKSKKKKLLYMNAVCKKRVPIVFVPHSFKFTNNDQ